MIFCLKAEKQMIKFPAKGKMFTCVVDIFSKDLPLKYTHFVNILLKYEKFLSKLLMLLKKTMTKLMKELFKHKCALIFSILYFKATCILDKLVTG